MGWIGSCFRKVVLVKWLLVLLWVVGLGLGLSGCRSPQPAVKQAVGEGFAPTSGVAEGGQASSVERIAGLDLPSYDGLRHGLGVRDVELGELREVPSGFPTQLGSRLRSGLTESQRFVVVPRAELWKMRPGEPSAASVPPARHLVRVRMIRLGNLPEAAEGSVNPDPDRPLRLLLQLELIDGLQDETVASVTITGLSGRTPPRPLAEGTPDARPLGPVTDPLARQLAELAQDAADQAVVFLVQQMQTKPFVAWVGPAAADPEAWVDADAETGAASAASAEGGQNGSGEATVSDGAVASGAAGQVVLNRGAAHRYPVGLRMTLIDPGRPLVDPATGQPLGHSEARPVGEVQIVRRGEWSSLARVLDAGGVGGGGGGGDGGGGGAVPPPGTYAEVER